MLRHQLNVLRRKSPKRLALRNLNRLILTSLYRIAPRNVNALVIVEPETVRDRKTERSSRGTPVFIAMAEVQAF